MFYLFNIIITIKFENIPEHCHGIFSDTTVSIPYQCKIKYLMNLIHKKITLI